MNRLWKLNPIWLFLLVAFVTCLLERDQEQQQAERGRGSTIQTEITKYWRRIHRFFPGLQKWCTLIFCFQSTQIRTSQPLNLPRKTQRPRNICIQGKQEHGHHVFPAQNTKQTRLSADIWGTCPDQILWKSARLTVFKIKHKNRQ